MCCTLAGSGGAGFNESGTEGWLEGESRRFVLRRFFTGMWNRGTRTAVCNGVSLTLPIVA